MEYDNVTDLAFKIVGKFLMISCLTVPYGFKFIHIILAIEHLILHSCVMASAQLPIEILTNGFFIKIKLLASVAYGPKVTAGVVDIAVDLSEYDLYYCLEGSYF